MRALVTGAGQRIGRVVALELANAGYDVAVHFATSKKAAEETCADIRALGRRACPLFADLLDEDQTLGLLPAAAEELGGAITCLVNNASIFEEDDLISATRASWDRHMGSNLRAPFVLTQAMAAQGLAAQYPTGADAVAAGCIINMVDQRVFKLTPQFATYSLAKSALWTLTQTAAQALAPHIRVNAIGPGPTLAGPRQSTDEFQRQRSATLLQRGADPAEIAAAVSYLARAKSVTGQMICVDGGQHLAWQTLDVLGRE